MAGAGPRPGRPGAHGGRGRGRDVLVPEAQYASWAGAPTSVRTLVWTRSAAQRGGGGAGTSSKKRCGDQFEALEPPRPRVTLDAAVRSRRGHEASAKGSQSALDQGGKRTLRSSPHGPPIPKHHLESGGRCGHEVGRARRIRRRETTWGGSEPHPSSAQFPIIDATRPAHGDLSRPWNHSRTRYGLAKARRGERAAELRSRRTTRACRRRRDIEDEREDASCHPNSFARTDRLPPTSSTVLPCYGLTAIPLV